MPGFTAEAALCGTSTHYHMRVAATRANGGVQPAFWFCPPAHCFAIRGRTVCLEQQLCFWFPDIIAIPPFKIPVPEPWTSVAGVPGLSGGGMAVG
jgi:hypothetical protein